MEKANNCPSDHPRILTVVEGRKEDFIVIEEFREVAARRGWKVAHIDSGINSDLLARYDLSDTPIEYVFIRDFTHNNYAETERFIDYLKQNHTIGVNLSATGGRAAASDKHYQQGLFLLDPFLRPYALPTFEAKRKTNVMSYIYGERVHFPIVLKHRFGSTGKNITLIRDGSDLDQIQSFDKLLIEQYIEADRDWRVFVIGGTAVGIMRKTGNPDHPDNFMVWSSGYTRSIEDNQDTREILSRIATRVAAVSHLEYAGIDIIEDRHTHQLYVLESNIAAGWLNLFTETTGVNIPECVIDWYEERGDARHQPIAKSVRRYIDNRKMYLSRETLRHYEAILRGVPDEAKHCAKYFTYEPAEYLYDAGLIFKKLASAYQDLTEHPNEHKDYTTLIAEIEQMPLSWAGNFIGPNLGTIEEGAILSALYIYVLGKIRKV